MSSHEIVTCKLLRKLSRNFQVVFIIFASLWIGHQIYQMHASQPSDVRTTRRAKVKVVIIGIGRSGTTFLGKLLRENEDVFYFFEPLQATYAARRPNDSMQLLNDIYSCNRPDNITLHWWIRHIHWIDASNVYKNGIPKRVNQRSLAAAIQDRCQKMRVIATKVLVEDLPAAAALWSIKNVLDTHKDLKIIYLVRDPWRVFHSRNLIGLNRKEIFDDYVERFCEMNWRNIQFLKNNSLYFKDRVKLLVFAEMATKPFDVITTYMNSSICPLCPHICTHGF